MANYDLYPSWIAQKDGIPELSQQASQRTRLQQIPQRIRLALPQQFPQIRQQSVGRKFLPPLHSKCTNENDSTVSTWYDDNGTLWNKSMWIDKNDKQCIIETSTSYDYDLGQFKISSTQTEL